MGILYLVSTPIGNLKDITIRAIKTLFSVDVILCEDTRRTGKLLTSLKELLNQQAIAIANSQSSYRLVTFHEYNEVRQTPKIIAMLQREKKLALVSDSGTPLVSDPGFGLVRECLKRGIAVIPIPGASSILASLVASGLPTQPFLFLGYPPEKSVKRRRLFQQLVRVFTLLGNKVKPPTIIFFAAPHKIVRILDDFLATFGDQPIVVARELTKIHEEFMRDRALAIFKRLKRKKVKGELTVLFNPAKS